LAKITATCSCEIQRLEELEQYPSNVIHIDKINILLNQSCLARYKYLKVLLKLACFRHHQACHRQTNKILHFVKHDKGHVDKNYTIRNRVPNLKCPYVCVFHSWINHLFSSKHDFSVRRLLDSSEMLRN